MIAGILAKCRRIREYVRRGGHVLLVDRSVSVGESLKGRRIVVTGGGSGIGRAIVKRFVDEGATVVITGRNLTKLRHAREQISSERVSVVSWDISDVSSIDAKMSDLKELLGGVPDVLVNNAGISIRGKPLDIHKKDWDAVIGTNLTGSVFLMQAFCKYWSEKKLPGVILNVASVAGVSGVMDAYGTSKASIIQLTRGWAKEFAKDRIRINAIAPGVIVGTEINPLQRLIAPDGNIFCESYPARRFGVPEEIADVALFLVSDASSYIYGQTIVCDGGSSL